MNDLDKDFEKTAKQINAKLQEAANALKEANRLASEAGLPALIINQSVREDDYYGCDEDDETSPLQTKFEMIDVSDLEEEMENSGWSASSSYC